MDRNPEVTFFIMSSLVEYRVSKFMPRRARLAPNLYCLGRRNQRSASRPSLNRVYLLR